MIYFALLPSGAVKIGYTVNVQQRMEQLRPVYGTLPTVLHTMPGDKVAEREIHRRFASLRFGSKEQFRPAPELMEFIGKPLVVSPDPDAVEVTPHPVRPIRLELLSEDVDRVEAVAQALGLNNAAYARMAVLKQLRADERRLADGGDE